MICIILATVLLVWIETTLSKLIKLIKYNIIVITIYHVYYSVGYKLRNILYNMLERNIFYLTRHFDLLGKF